MRVIRIPKGRGRFRTIYAPNQYEKEQANQWHGFLAVLHRDRHGVQHGFRPARSSVTNALAHRNFRFTLSFDLKDFFDTVRPGHLSQLAPIETLNHLFKACFYDGAARQGIPTSPAIANIAAAPMDREIVAMNRQSRLGPMFVYTRYADDLTFSFNYSGTEEMLRVEIPKLVAKHGFKLNEAKTHLQHARQGRRVITGVAVDDHGTHLPRSVKRKLRAIEHQASNGLRGRGLRFQISRQRDRRRRGDPISLHALLQGQRRGLQEWSKLKLPEGYNNRPRPTVAATNSTQSSVPTATNNTMPYPTMGQRQFAL